MRFGKSLHMKPTPHYLKSLGMSIPAVLIGLQLSAWIGFVLSPERQNRADFRAYYYAGEIVRSGRPHHLYDSYDRANITSAFIHPAYEAALFVPLTFLSIRTAHAVWIVINLGILAWISRLLNFAVANLRALLWWLPAAILAAFLPISECLMQGQDSLLLLFLIVLAFERLHREELFLAGALLGLGTFRFQFLAIVVLLFLLWKCWNFVAGFCTSAICMILA